MSRSGPVPFDTHRFVKRMTEAGMPPEQAEALVEEQVALLDPHIATKQDVAELVAAQANLATKQDVAELAAGQSALAAAQANLATKEEVAELAAGQSALAAAQANLATKEDVAELAAGQAELAAAQANLATKEDVAVLAAGQAALAAAQANLATKEEVAVLAARQDQLATKEDLAAVAAAQASFATTAHSTFATKDELAKVRTDARYSEGEGRPHALARFIRRRRCRLPDLPIDLAFLTTTFALLERRVQQPSRNSARGEGKVQVVRYSRRFPTRAVTGELLIPMAASFPPPQCSRSACGEDGCAPPL